MYNALMKRVLILFALCFSFSLRAQAQEPVPLARGNTPGEPHHHLKIENEYVRVYYVEVPPHEDTQIHQHDHDYLFVTLGDSDVINAVHDKPEVHLVLKDGETHFTRGGFAHVARNLADTPFRNITVELLKPQGEARNLCAPVVASQAFVICEPPLRADYGRQREFETPEMTMDLVWLHPKARHSENVNALIIWLGDSEIKATAKGKSPRTARGGELAWFDATSRVQFLNEGSKTAEFLEIIFKDARTQSPKT